MSLRLGWTWLPNDGQTGSNRILGSEEARSRAGLRPPPKLPVHISCRQLSRRLSNAERQEKVLSRSDGQARTRRKAVPWAAVSSPHCANVCSNATRCAAGPSRRDVGRACGCGLVCNTRPTLAREGLAPRSAPWLARAFSAWCAAVLGP